MPVSELDVANALFWLCGFNPGDHRARELASALDLNRTRDAAHLREVLLGSDALARLLAERPRHPANPPLELDRPRLVFLHIPKCGGTTLHQILKSHVDPHRVCPERWNGLRSFRLDELASFTLFSGHFDLESCQALLGRRTKIVTMLRDPRDRLVSLYYFLKIHRTDGEPVIAGLVSLARSLSIEDFFRHPLIRRHASVYNAMASLLIEPQWIVRWEAIDGQRAQTDLVVSDPERAGHLAVTALASLTSFGILEQFQDSLDLLSDALGMRLENGPALQVTDELRTLDHLDYAERPAVTPALLDILDELTVADRILYREAQQVFAARLVELRDRGPAAIRHAHVGPAELISLDRFSPIEGRRDGPVIVASGTEGVLASGPYLRCDHGGYRLICHFVEDMRPEAQAGFTVNIWSQMGRTRYERVVWTGPGPCIVDFVLAFDVLDLEFVISVGADSRFELQGVELARAVAAPDVAPEEGPAPPVVPSTDFAEEPAVA